MNRRIGKAVAAVLVLVGCWISSAPIGAEPMLDQNYYSADQSPSFWAIIGDEGDWAYNSRHAQTFAVGVTGTLSRIEFPVWEIDYFPVPPPVTYKILTTTNEDTPSPTQTVLASGICSLPQSQQGPFVIDIATDGGVAVVQGEQLAISLEVARRPQNIGLGFEIGGTSQDFASGYPLGALFYNGPTTWLENDGDLYFRTYVEPIPEPTSILALMTGMGCCLAATLRARRGRNRDE